MGSTIAVVDNSERQVPPDSVDLNVTLLPAQVEIGPLKVPATPVFETVTVLVSEDAEQASVCCATIALTTL